MLKYELDPAMSRLPRDVGEVVAYLRAMNHGLERPTMPPMTLGRIREIHAELKRGVQGAEKRPATDEISVRSLAGRELSRRWAR